MRCASGRRYPGADMRVGVNRAAVTWACGLVAVAVCTALAFGPLVRLVVRRQSDRLNLTVQVGSVRPSGWGVHLRDVLVTAEAMPGVTARASDVVLTLSWRLRLKHVAVGGGELTAVGPLGTLRQQYECWRGLRHDLPRGEPGQEAPSLRVDDGTVRWTEGSPGGASFEAQGVHFGSLGGAMTVAVVDARGQLGRVAFSAVQGVAKLGRQIELSSAHVQSVTIEWTAAGDVPEEDSATRLLPPAVRPLDRTAPPGRRRGHAAPPHPRPLMALPRLEALSGRIAAAVAALMARSEDGAGIDIDALTWKITRPGERVPLTVGPGTLAGRRGRDGLDARFRTDAGSTAIAVSARLPSDGSDYALTLDGGPVSLAMLGVQEQAFGLVDVARATATGRARVALAADGSALLFDADVGTRDVSVDSEKLAPEPVRGLDLAVRARGLLAASGELRVDDFAASLGALQVHASGTLNQDAQDLVATLHFDMPTAPCQSIVDSLPTALLPVLTGTTIAGTFAGHGRLDFDTRSLDDLRLDYDFEDGCHLVEVPPSLAREQFERPFAHRIYLPDGSIGEQVTGPGTANWTSLGDISPFMQIAVLTTEDGGFLRHHGFNRASIRASLIANLKARRFVRGASTITMQLAKNLFLTRTKTVSRKLEEVVLTDYLEQTFSKEELMELYLNVIEFGPSVYGVTTAAEHYFGRTPAELNLAESLFLASLLPSPLRYGAVRDSGELSEGWMRTLHSLMQIAHKNGWITDAELTEAQGEPVIFWRGDDSRPTPPPAAQTHLRVGGGTDDATTTPSDDALQPGP